MKTNNIVIGLGFGDEGKGLVVDNLSTDKSLVVRFSGGQQCGHTVIRNGIKHVFSNFGSGTLQGCPTFFTEDTSIYLNTIFNEKAVLEKKGVSPVLYVHPHTKITTPYDVIANRANTTNGSCGLGIGTTMMRHNSSPYKLYAVDLFAPANFLRKKLDTIYSYYYKTITDFSALLELSDELDRFNENLEKPRPFELKNFYRDLYPHYNNIVFEGSQGVLLDAEHGLFPNVTYANTTSRNAWKYIKDVDFTTVFGVTRCYQTRHGTGWMSNNTFHAHDPSEKYQDIPLINNQEEINCYNTYQSHFRIGEIDYSLLNHAIRVEQSHQPYDRYNIPINNLVVTCIDQRPYFQFDYSKISAPIHTIFENNSPHSGNMNLYEL